MSSTSRNLMLLAVALTVMLGNLMDLHYSVLDRLQQQTLEGVRNLQREENHCSSLQRRLADDSDLSHYLNISAAHILENGFPIQCSDGKCAENPRSASTGAGNGGEASAPFQLVFVGGSATARRPNNCKRRYTDILQEKLDQDSSSIRFETRNLAHGATDSMWSALFMDEILDTETTDVVIWEFAINDALGGLTGKAKRTEKNLREMMDLWLWRLVQHFETAGRRVPSIVLLYLWDSNSIKDGSVQQSAYEAQKAVVDYYQRSGLHISVVNVGGAVNGTDVAQSKTNLLDDYHHPNCDASHLIANMLRHALYHDICPCLNQQSSRDDKRNQIMQSLMPFTSIAGNQGQAILGSMLGKGQIGSLMQWKPQNGTSTLTIGNESNTETEAMHGSKTSATRSDRKVSYKLEVCPKTTRILLREPYLEWLGLGVCGGNAKRHTFGGQIQVSINGNTASLVNATYSLEMDTIPLVNYWFRVADIVSKAPQYEIEVCNLAGKESRCPFHDVATVTEGCQMWANVTGKNIDKCFFGKARNVRSACDAWYKSKEGQAKQRKYGWWRGVGKASLPQLNWIVGIKAEHY